MVGSGIIGFCAGLLSKCHGCSRQQAGRQGYYYYFSCPDYILCSLFTRGVRIWGMGFSFFFYPVILTVLLILCNRFYRGFSYFQSLAISYYFKKFVLDSGGLDAGQGKTKTNPIYGWKLSLMGWKRCLKSLLRAYAFRKLPLQHCMYVHTLPLTFCDYIVGCRFSCISFLVFMFSSFHFAVRRIRESCSVE